ncbi:MAG: hypothetical protein U0326_05650 [Polyangiales bacterium]
MIPWKKLDSAVAPDGTLLTLHQHDRDFSIRADGRALMGSRMHASEDALATKGCAGARRDARVLVGGLGLGFTLRAALDVLSPEGRVDVVELMPAVVKWNREHLGHLARHPLDDPRVTLHERDVADVIAAARDHYDALLLDVDNGPSAFVQKANARLYDHAGLRRAHRALRVGGTFALWSLGGDPRFTEALDRAGFDGRAERVKAHGQGGGTHLLWLATRRAERAPR